MTTFLLTTEGLNIIPPKNGRRSLQNALQQPELKAFKTQKRGGSNKMRDELIGKLELWCKDKKIPYKKEFKFMDNRKYRFDFYIEANNKKIGIEIDGVFSEKSRHLTVSGFTNDHRKKNLAQINGNIVLCYTVINRNEVFSDLEKLLF